MTRKCVGDVLHQSLSAHQFGISVFTSRYRTTDSRSSAHTASILTAHTHIHTHKETHRHRVTPTAPRVNHMMTLVIWSKPVRLGVCMAVRATWRRQSSLRRGDVCWLSRLSSLFARDKLMLWKSNRLK